MKYMRRLVAGPKNKTPYQGQQLDLTYITDRIIAMAYPASNFIEKAYRNSIHDVAGYFNQYHAHAYLIVNVSSRSYDYGLFQNRVLEYQWPDHQAPPVTTLFDIAAKCHQYLKNVQNGVVAVHCNHGKGRTGTAIIAILLFLGCYKNAEEALSFYNDRRFSSDNYGVNQPCQLRYLQFVQKLLYLPKIPKNLVAYRLAKVTQSGLHDKHFISIKHVRTGKTLVQNFPFLFMSKVSDYPLIGDLFIEVFEEGWATNKHIARINYHTFFINPVTQNSIGTLQKNPISLVLKGSCIKCSKSADKDFSITLVFQYYCLCHLEEAMEDECECHKYRITEEDQWRKLGKQAHDAHQIWKQQGCQYFLTHQPAIEPVLEKAKVKEEKEEVEHELFPLSKTLSNMSNNYQVIGIIKDGPDCKLKELDQFSDEQNEEYEQEGSDNIRERRTRQFNLQDFKKCKQKIRQKQKDKEEQE